MMKNMQAWVIKLVHEKDYQAMKKGRDQIRSICYCLKTFIWFNVIYLIL